MEFSKIKLSIESDLAILRFNNPDNMNAIDQKMLAGFGLALDEIEHGGHRPRCLLITGEGRAFCSGADLSDAFNAAPKSNVPLDIGAGLESSYHPLLRRLRNLEMPIITAVNGAAAGIGMSFALMGDMVLAGRSAFFLQAFCRIGLVPDGGATWLLPRLVGVARAREMSLFGERIPAETAQNWGLVNRVYDDDRLMDEAVKLSGKLSKGPTVALTLIRNLYWNSLGNSYEEQIDLERQAQKIAGRTKDSSEGVSAFLEKRAPRFKGE